MTRIASGTLALMAVLLLPACGSPRKAAESSIATAQSAYDRIRDEAMNVAPVEAGAIEDAIAAARVDVENANFKAAQEAADRLPAEVGALEEMLPGRRTTLETAWEHLDATVPVALASLHRELGSTKRRPKGMSRTAFQSAVIQLDQLKSNWAEAQSAEQSGRLAEAVMKAEETRVEAVQLSAELHPGS